MIIRKAVKFQWMIQREREKSYYYEQCPQFGAKDNKTLKQVFGTKFIEGTPLVKRFKCCEKSYTEKKYQ